MLSVCNIPNPFLRIEQIMTAFFEWQICNDLKVVDTISQMCWAINSTFIEYLINWVDSNQLIVFKISICCIDGRNDLGKTSSNPLVPLLICQSLRVCNFKANAHAIRQGPFWMKIHLVFFSRPFKSILVKILTTKCKINSTY